MSRRMSWKKKCRKFDEYRELMNEWRPIDDELAAMCHAGKITPGEYYYVLSRFQNYGVQIINKSFDGPKPNWWDNITGWGMTYALEQIREGMERTRARLAELKEASK